MTWECKACGANDNPADALRCTCGFEKLETPDQETCLPDQSASESTRLEGITVCPECKSANIEKFNTNKRGKIMLVGAAAWFLIAVVTNTLGYTWFGVAILLVVGFRWVLKDQNIIVCRDCMYSNNNKWLKRMKDA